jgi:hypothetical protein
MKWVYMAALAALAGKAVYSGGTIESVLVVIGFAVLTKDLV